MAVLKIKPRMGLKNGVRKPAQKSVAPSSRAGGGCSKSPKKGGVIMRECFDEGAWTHPCAAANTYWECGSRKNETSVLGSEIWTPKWGPAGWFSWGQCIDSALGRAAGKYRIGKNVLRAVSQTATGADAGQVEWQDGHRKRAL